MATLHSVELSGRDKSCFYQKILTVLHPMITGTTNFNTII